jgi:hypothetical protein
MIRRAFVSIVATMIFLALGATLTSADFILNVLDSDGNAWVATSKQNITGAVTEQNPMTGQTVRVSITVTFTTDDPIVITITEVLKAPRGAGGSKKNDPRDNPKGGLNFLIDQALINNSDVDWTTFGQELPDDTPVAAALGTNMHPAIPHFHNRKTMFTPGAKKNVFESDDELELRLETPVAKKGGTLQVKALRIHEIAVENKQRIFRLTMTPNARVTNVVPEPGSFALLGIGVLCSTLVYAWRQRAAARRYAGGQGHLTDTAGVGQTMTHT